MTEKEWDIGAPTPPEAWAAISPRDTMLLELALAYAVAVLNRRTLPSGRVVKPILQSDMAALFKRINTESPYRMADVESLVNTAEEDTGIRPDLTC